MPTLETARLRIRPFVLDDLEAIHRILDIELHDANAGDSGTQALNERRQWLQWSVMNYEQLAKLYQPPYGDRAVVLKQTGQLIGTCGYAPCLFPFGLLPLFATDNNAANGLNTNEIGLYYAFSPAHQRQGYATEAAHALVDYGFKRLNLRRIVATTSFDNHASASVMTKLGMRLERNPNPEPFYLQIVGVLDNPLVSASNGE